MIFLMHVRSMHSTDFIFFILCPVCVCVCSFLSCPLLSRLALINLVFRPALP